MNNISFTSRLRPVNNIEFNAEIKSFGKNCMSLHPWTIKQSVYNDKVGTKGVYDCSVCLITDGVKALLLHLCPDMEANKNFNSISDFIKRTIDLNKNNLQAFLAGSNILPESSKLYSNLRNFLKQNKIPTSELCQAIDSSISVAYRSDKDEILVYHDKVNTYQAQGLSNIEIFNKCFKNVYISDCDEV